MGCPIWCAQNCYVDVENSLYQRLVVREVLSFFTITAIAESEKAETLREILIFVINSLPIPTLVVCVCVDEALAFESLSKCPILNEFGNSWNWLN